jgi:hypothetical protein
MAEILIHNAGRFNPSDPVRDRKLYKPGDPIVIMPDNTSWGVRECWPEYLVVRVPGFAPAELFYLIEEDQRIVDIFRKEDAQMTTRRLRRFRLEDMPTPEIKLVKRSRWWVPEKSLDWFVEKGTGLPVSEADVLEPAGQIYASIYKRVVNG